MMMMMMIMMMVMMMMMMVMMTMVMKMMTTITITVTITIIAMRSLFFRSLHKSRTIIACNGMQWTMWAVRIPVSGSWIYEYLSVRCEPQT